MISYSDFLRELVELQTKGELDTDVLIVGGGLTGLMAGYRLALRDVDVLIVDRNVYLGGDAWVSGYLNMVMSSEKSIKRVFDELGIQYQEDEQGYVVTYTPLVIARLIERAIVSGARIINASSIEDVIVSDNVIRGAVMRWSVPKSSNMVSGESLDEKIIRINSRYIIDASGFEGRLARIVMSRGLHRLRSIDKSLSGIESLVEYTREVVPGLIVAGTAILQYYRVPSSVSIDHGLSILSGEKAADLVIRKILGRMKNSSSGTRGGGSFSLAFNFCNLF